MREEKEMLTIRQSDKQRNYWQVGYYQKSKWHMVMNLSTPKRLVRELQKSRTEGRYVPITQPYKIEEN